MLSAYEKGALNNSRHFHLAWLSKIFILIKNACKFYHRLSTSVKLIIQLSPFSLLMSWFALIDFLMLNQLCIMEIGPPRSGGTSEAYILCGFQIANILLKCCMPKFILEIDPKFTFSHSLVQFLNWNHVACLEWTWKHVVWSVSWNHWNNLGIMPVCYILGSGSGFF